MDFTYLDDLLLTTKKLDKDLQELVSLLSLPSATPSAALRTDFLNATDARCESILRVIEEVELGTLFGGARKASSEELIDAAGDAVVQIERQCEAAMGYLEQYGYQPPAWQKKKKTRQPAPVDAENIPDPKAAEPSSRPTAAPAPSSPSSIPHQTGSSSSANAAPMTPPAKTPPRGSHGTTTANISPSDSPLASLEDLGLSSLSMGLLTGTAPDTPYAPARTPMRRPLASAMMDSPAPPTFRTGRDDFESPPEARRTDPQSMFKDNLIANISEEEYAKLPIDIRGSMHCEFLNEMISEINEAIKDKRFSGDMANEITAEELCNAAMMDAARCMAVIMAMVQLQRLKPVNARPGETKRYAVVV
ncbi:uncharacterized protein EV422DRAFT_614290 [Fimicolochytrium jonesii]|uniref:uncharacterized protein n=1 Tax=Fimicolochytrium jonesii TaxID=1396493 RepID=UPI0022FF171C|nr:uncharacterized protein EV422DRAFT_614290 [Fimicolochytrium jonesii]KAI8822002.1 hypothetical protein EV422DRAFT_614290 [Fimicolochytrium jonesii]